MDEFTKHELVELVDIFENLAEETSKRGLHLDNETLQKMAVTLYLQAPKAKFFAQKDKKDMLS